MATCTVRDIVGNPTLATRVLAGARGLDRDLTWAHSIEIARPWEWLGSGELLMTTGQNFPDGAEQQVAFIRNLDTNGISGLALAERMASGLTPEAIEVSDALGFPILETAYEIPFVLLARAVAATSGRDKQMAAIQRVYELYRQSTLDGVSGEEVLTRLGREVGARLRVLMVGDWSLVLADDDEFHGFPKEILERFPTSAPLSAVTQVSDDARTRILLLPISDARRYALAADVGEQAVDLVLLQHVAAITGVLAEMRAAESATRLHSSTRLFTQLLDGTYDADSARATLEELGLGTGPWAVAAIETAAEADLLRTHWQMRRAGVPTLIYRPRHYTLVLFPEERRQELRNSLEADADQISCAGISNSIRRLAAISDGVREAAWASQAARGDGSKVAEYGLDRPLFMPATVTEARGIVEHVLGAITSYDEEHGTELLRSLEVYFEENRAGTAASKRLSIHRQTLIYRLKRLEQITSRRLDDFDDLTELHLAMKMRRYLVADMND